MTDIEMWTKAFLAALNGVAAKNIHVSESGISSLRGGPAMKVSALGIEGALVQSAITIATGSVSAFRQAEKYYTSYHAAKDDIESNRDTDVSQ